MSAVDVVFERAGDLMHCREQLVGPNSGAPDVMGLVFISLPWKAQVGFVPVSYHLAAGLDVFLDCREQGSRLGVGG